MLKTKERPHYECNAAALRIAGFSFFKNFRLNLEVYRKTEKKVPLKKLPDLARRTALWEAEPEQRH